MKTIVIGISGISGGGKTTLAIRLHEFLGDVKNAHVFHGYRINEVILIQQDKYFYPRDSPHHIWIPEINFINRERLAAIDMDRCTDDIRSTVQRLRSDNISIASPIIAQTNNEIVDINILIVEGFLIYNDQRINQLCQLRFHIRLSYDVGLQRRLIRTFKHINPNPQWYYQHYIWPMYNKHLNEVPNKSDLVFLDGEPDVDFIYHQAYETIAKFITTQFSY